MGAGEPGLSPLYNNEKQARSVLTSKYPQTLQRLVLDEAFGLLKSSAVLSTCSISRDSSWYRKSDVWEEVSREGMCAAEKALVLVW